MEMSSPLQSSSPPNTPWSPRAAATEYRLVVSSVRWSPPVTRTLGSGMIVNMAQLRPGLAPAAWIRLGFCLGSQGVIFVSWRLPELVNHDPGSGSLPMSFRIRIQDILLSGRHSIIHNSDNPYNTLFQRTMKSINV